jgi:hypothetical protein
MGVGAKGIAFATLLATWLFPVVAQEADAPPRGTDEVRLPGLAIGRSYSTWRLAEAPFAVRNTSPDTLRVRVEIVVPARHETRPGALPVPDRAWIALERREFTVMPQSEHRTDVRLTLPYDPDLAGHTYQVDVACAERRPGGWVMRQRYRLLFSVEMDYRDDTEIDLAAQAIRLGAL